MHIEELHDFRAVDLLSVWPEHAVCIAEFLFEISAKDEITAKTRYKQFDVNPLTPNDL
jgi:hypothetical protein